MSEELDFMIVEDAATLTDLANNAVGVLLYFGGDHCNVCQAMRPKVLELFRARFPDMQLAYIDTERHTEIAAQNGVFSLPSLHLYFDGRETQRLERGFSIGQLSAAIERPYGMLFD